MSEFDLTIRGGMVVTSAGQRDADIGVKDGVIARIAEKIDAGPADIDAQGRLVLPGGIDGHCHIEQLSSFGLMNADDFYTASVAAAHGGTTTVVPFAAQHHGQSVSEVVSAYRQLAAEKAAIDYHLHIIVTDPTDDVLTKELPPLIESGFRTLKLFLTYDLMKVDDYQTLQVMEVARKRGALIVAHAENNDMIRWATEKLIDGGHNEPKYHAISHPRLAEAEAVHRAIVLARFIDVPIMIFHVTTREAMDEVRRAQEAGFKVYAETCTQYLVLTADDLNRPGSEGAKYCCSPPLRDGADVQAMWEGLADGTFVTLSSDHAPYAYDETGKLNAGDNPAFKQIPNGLPGLELRMPVLFSEGVKTGRIDLGKFVDLTSTGIARLYGLYPQKGEIAVGSDADIAIWNPDAKKTISDDMVHDNTGYSPFTGRTVTGWPECVISRGRVVVRHGKTDMAPGSGRMIKRALSELAKPLGRSEPEMNEKRNFGARMLG